MKNKGKEGKIVLDDSAVICNFETLLPGVKLCIIYSDCLCSRVLFGRCPFWISFNDLYQREENETITSGCCSDRSCCFCLWQKRSPGCSCCPGCCPSSCCCRSGRRCTCCCRSGCCTCCCSCTSCQVIAFLRTWNRFGGYEKPAFGPVFLCLSGLNRQPVKPFGLRCQIETFRHVT